MGIFLLFILAIFLLWRPLISPWLKRMLANRTEDYIRKATGMPPRPGSREERKQQRAYQQSQGEAEQSSRSYYSGGSRFSGGSRSNSRRRGRRRSDEPLIPREYAEDVEFVEIKSFSETSIGEAAGKEREYHESQVTDVEWVEIKQKQKR